MLCFAGGIMGVRERGVRGGQDMAAVNARKRTCASTIGSQHLQSPYFDLQPALLFFFAVSDRRLDSLSFSFSNSATFFFLSKKKMAVSLQSVASARNVWLRGAKAPFLFFGAGYFARWIGMTIETLIALGWIHS